jgi:HK97 family phage portal protein
MPNEELVLLDSRGKPIEKSLAGESQWRGPFSGIGEFGNTFQLSSWEDGWQRNLTVGHQAVCAAAYAAMQVYAHTVSILDLKHYRMRDDGGRDEISTSALSRIARNPNAYQTWPDFCSNLIFSLLSSGNFYALAFRNDRAEVDSLHIVPPTGTSPYVDTETGSVFYAVGTNPMLGDIAMMIPARDVLHIRMFTPNHPLIGISQIQYAATAIGINNSISRNQFNFFQNMSRPSGVLTTDEKLTRDQLEDLRNAWRQRSSGLRSGDVPILSWGLKWDSMSLTSQDAELIEAYRMSIEDIARVFNMPSMLLNDYRNATYNNAESLINFWLTSGLGFILEHLEAAFTKFFRLPPRESAQFDEQRLLRTDFQSRMDAYSKAIQGGVYAPNEVRRREKLPSVEAGDSPRLQAQVVPLEQINATPAPSAPVPESAPVNLQEEERIYSADEVEYQIKKWMH